MKEIVYTCILVCQFIDEVLKYALRNGGQEVPDSDIQQFLHGVRYSVGGQYVSLALEILHVITKWLREEYNGDL